VISRDLEGEEKEKVLKRLQHLNKTWNNRHVKLIIFMDINCFDASIEMISTSVNLK
jgi:hypothetical protein